MHEYTRTHTHTHRCGAATSRSWRKCCKKPVRTTKWCRQSCTKNASSRLDMSIWSKPSSSEWYVIEHDVGTCCGTWRSSSRYISIYVCADVWMKTWMYGHEHTIQALLVGIICDWARCRDMLRYMTLIVKGYINICVCLCMDVCIYMYIYINIYIYAYM